MASCASIADRGQGRRGDRSSHHLSGLKISQLSSLLPFSSYRLRVATDGIHNVQRAMEELNGRTIAGRVIARFDTASAERRRKSEDMVASVN